MSQEEPQSMQAPDDSEKTAGSNVDASPAASMTDLESENTRLRSIIDHSRSAYAIAGTDGVVSWLSPLAGEWLKSNFDVTLRKGDSLELVCKESGGCSLMAAVASAREGRNAQFDCVFEEQGGSDRRYEVNVSPVKAEDSVAGEILVEFSDVRHRGFNTEHLLAGDEFFTGLVQNSSDIITLIDGEGSVRYMSPAIEPVLGFPAESMIDREIEALIHPEDLERLKKDFLLAGMAPGTQLTGSFRVQHADGTWLHLESVATNLLHNEYIRGFVINSRDVTERKKAEQVAAMEKKWLVVTLKSIGDGVITTDTSGRTRMLNLTAERLTGYTQKQAVGRQLAEIYRVVDPQTAVPIETPLAALLEHAGAGREHLTNAPIYASEGILAARDGTEQSVSQSGALIRDDDGEVMGMVLVFRDETSKQRLSEEMSRASRLESIGVLAGGIAHDFNNILLAVIGNITLARTDVEEGSDAYTRLTDAEDATFRARDLTQQLLTFSKGGTPLLNTMHLHEIIRESVEFMLHGSNLELALDIPEDMFPVDVDAGQIGQVLTNLTVNAKQAMNGGGRIDVIAKNRELKDSEVSSLPAGRYVAIEVRDTGSGIPDDIKAKLFDPFFTTKETGSGLGLATSYSIIKKHGGVIQVDSEVGRGTSFIVYLPASKKTPEVKVELEGEDLRGRGRLLLMDDDEYICLSIPSLLGGYGYTVDIASDGAEMLRKYKAAVKLGNRYDCVIMDLTIPGGMGGKEAIVKLREYDPRAKAIVSSGYSQDAVMSSHKEHGFDGVLAKPYRCEALARVIKQVLVTSIDSIQVY